MTKELTDFFKIISEGKKKSVKEQNDNESLLSNEKVSVTVKATELKDFFSAINEEKRKLKEQREKDQKKLQELELNKQEKIYFRPNEVHNLIGDYSKARKILKKKWRSYAAKFEKCVKKQ